MTKGVFFPKTGDRNRDRDRDRARPVGGAGAGQRSRGIGALGKIKKSRHTKDI